MTELYPEGKRLWLAVCEVRGVEAVRAELEWEQWEEGFLTRGEWQRTAEKFTASAKASACSCEACRPNTLSDMRMILCATCGNKRCPHATNHLNACTNSNSPGQPGSSYGPASKVKAALSQWEDVVRAEQIPLEDHPAILDKLVEHLGLKIVREQTPDYTSYELQAHGKSGG